MKLHDRVQLKTHHDERGRIIDFKGPENGRQFKVHWDHNSIHLQGKWIPESWLKPETNPERSTLPAALQERRPRDFSGFAREQASQAARAAAAQRCMHGPMFIIRDAAGVHVGNMQVTNQSGVFFTTITLTFEDMQASEDMFNYLARQGFPGCTVTVED